MRLSGTVAMSSQGMNKKVLPFRSGPVQRLTTKLQSIEVSQQNNDDEERVQRVVETSERFNEKKIKISTTEHMFRREKTITHIIVGTFITIILLVVSFQS